VSFWAGGDGPDADVEMAAEAMIRLVYGRLDPAHTRPLHGADAVDELRRVFPGV
jgi:hypothetical protein